MGWWMGAHHSSFLDLVPSGWVGSGTTTLGSSLVSRGSLLPWAVLTLAARGPPPWVRPWPPGTPPPPGRAPPRLSHPPPPPPAPFPHLTLCHPPRLFKTQPLPALTRFFFFSIACVFLLKYGYPTSVSCCFSLPPLTLEHKPMKAQAWSVVSSTPKPRIDHCEG